jgi:hypothetical protein
MENKYESTYELSFFFPKNYQFNIIFVILLRDSPSNNIIDRVFLVNIEKQVISFSDNLQKEYLICICQTLIIIPLNYVHIMTWFLLCYYQQTVVYE